jgi:hypothetical protein
VNFYPRVFSCRRIGRRSCKNWACVVTSNGLLVGSGYAGLSILVLGVVLVRRFVDDAGPRIQRSNRPARSGSPWFGAPTRRKK